MGEGGHGDGSPAQDRLPGWWEYLGLSGVARLLVLAGLVVWLYWAHCVRLFEYWQRPDWSHGFLIPLFCLYLVHTKRRELLLGEHEGSLWGLALMLLSVLVYATSIYLKIGYPQPLTIVSMIAGIVLLLRGWRTLWLTSFPIGFLVLAMPPPERLYRAVTQPLQQGAAAISTLILRMFPGADVEHQGINISFFMDDGSEGGFTVAGACSGMRSLMAFVALGLAMAYFAPRPTWHRITMAVLVVPVALFCNIVRVIVTGGFQMYGLEDYATGTPHTVLGLLLFVLGFAIYMGVLWLLDHLFVDDPGWGKDDEAAISGEAL
ncbi:MAG: exosortase/archaeosortase family protein [Planctomycetota bacterium]